MNRAELSSYATRNLTKDRIERFVRDYYPAVKNQFGSDMQTERKIDILLDDCYRNERLANLEKNIKAFLITLKKEANTYSAKGTNSLESVDALKQDTTRTYLYIDRDPLTDDFLNAFDKTTKDANATRIFILQGEAKDRADMAIERCQLEYDEEFNKLPNFKEIQGLRNIDLSSNRWKKNLDRNLKKYFEFEGENDEFIYSNLVINNDKFSKEINFMYLILTGFHVETFFEFCHTLYQIQSIPGKPLVVFVSLSVGKLEQTNLNDIICNNELDFVTIMGLEIITPQHMNTFYNAYSKLYEINTIAEKMPLDDVLKTLEYKPQL